MKKKKQTTQINLLIRCVVAVYLIYLAHSIIKELDTAPNVRLMVVFAIAFTFAGVLIIAFTIRAYVNKDYTDFRNQEDEQADQDTSGYEHTGEDSPDTLENVSSVQESESEVKKPKNDIAEKTDKTVQDEVE